MKMRLTSTEVHFFYLLALRTTRAKYLEILKGCGINNAKIPLTLKIDKSHIFIDKLNQDVSVYHLGDPGIKEDENEYISVRNIFIE